MNAHISAEQSGFVVELIKEAVVTVGISPAVITEYMVRKAAHFCEYALFGLLITSTIHAWRVKIKPHVYMLLFWCLLIPVSDESLQLFVDGRAGMVQDVVLDFAGAIFGILVYVGISSLLRFCRKGKHNKGRLGM
jgi:VanZ family protein